MLVDFLRTEIGLGFDFASMGNTEAAQKAIHAIEHFVEQVEDSLARREISQDLAKLKSQMPSHLKPNR